MHPSIANKFRFTLKWNPYVVLATYPLTSEWVSEQWHCVYVKKVRVMEKKRKECAEK